MPKARINGIDLFWVEAGSGEPLLLLHGFPLDHTMWQPQIEYFSKRNWRVIAPDHRGFGQSEITPGSLNSMDLLAQDAAALLDYLKIEKAAVMALSMGGYVSFALYRQFPEKVRALVLADTKAEPDSPLAREGRYKLREVIKEKGSSAARDEMLPKMFAPEVYTRNSAMVEQLGAVMAQTRPETIIATLPGIAERPDSLPLVPEINLPVLVIHGDQDSLMPVEKAREMANSNPGWKFRSIPRAGHMSNLENPEFFNREVESFLEEAIKS